MTTSASREEFEALMDQLGEHVAPDRRAPIARMMFEVVSICPICDEPIRRCDKRTLVELDDGKRQLVHLSLACAGRDPESGLSGQELQEAQDAPVRRLEQMRAEAAKRRRRWES